MACASTAHSERLMHHNLQGRSGAGRAAGAAGTAYAAEFSEAQAGLADDHRIEFFPQILEHFCPLFVQIAQIGLILPRWGLILPRSPPPAPVLYSAVTHPFRGYVRTQNTPKPTPKHPFSWPEFESGQNEQPSGQFGPQLGKMFKKWAKP